MEDAPFKFAGNPRPIEDHEMWVSRSTFCAVRDHRDELIKKLQVLEERDARHQEQFRELEHKQDELFQALDESQLKLEALSDELTLFQRSLADAQDEIAKANQMTYDAVKTARHLASPTSAQPLVIGSMLSGIAASLAQRRFDELVESLADVIDTFFGEINEEDEDEFDECPECAKERE